MTPPTPQASLKVRLAQSLWRQLKERASHRQMELEEYADMIFRYLWHDHQRTPTPVARRPGMEEEVYFDLQLPATTKQRLAEWSQTRQSNLAGFGGGLVRWYFERHERDPRDLAMVHYVSSHLDDNGVLSHADLVLAIARCERNTGVRMPPGYFARWLYGRLEPLVKRIRVEGTSVNLTVAMVEQILSRKP